MAQQQEPPKIEFPCAYPIKVLGRASADYETLILSVFEQHAPDFERDTIVVKTSAKGTFTSMTVIITATGPDQLETLHQALMATGSVNMVI